MPVNLDIFYREVVAKDPIYGSVAIMLTGEASPEIKAVSSILLPISVYQNASGSFLQASIYQNTSGTFLPTTVFEAASTGFAPSNIYQSLTSNWETAYSQSQTIGQYLPLSGGSVTGDLSITGNISGFNTTVFFNAGSATGFRSFATNTGQATATNSFAEGSNTSARGSSSHAEGQFTIASGTASHAEGNANVASGTFSHVQGANSEARGLISHAQGSRSRAIGDYTFAGGRRAVAKDDYSYVWATEISPATTEISSTRVGQYMVSALGGVFIPGRVGIGTDSINNALTVVGTISTSNHGDSSNWNTAYQHVSSQSLNITDSPTFSKINLVNGAAVGSFEVYEEGAGSKFDFGTDGNARLTLQTTEATFYVPIAVSDLTQRANTRTNLGLGSTDNVEFNQVNANVYLSGGINLINLLSGTGSGSSTDLATVANYLSTNNVILSTVTLNPIAALPGSNFITSRILQDKLGEVISVKDFGARGDGVTNDWLSIQRALSAAAGIARVYIPQGLYFISQELKIPSNSYIYGAGIGTTIIKLSSTANATQCVMTNSQNTRSVATNQGNENIIIKDLELDGNVSRFPGSYSPVGDASGTGLCFAYVRNALVERVSVHDTCRHCFDIGAPETSITFNPLDYVPNPSFNIHLKDIIAYGAGDDNITTHFSHNIIIENAYVPYTGGTEVPTNSNGIEIDDGSYDITIIGGYIKNCRRGLEVKGHSWAPAAKRVKVYALTVENCVRNFGIRHLGFDSTDSKTAFDVVLYDCTSIAPVSSTFTTDTPRSLQISNYDGVFVKDFKVVGEHNASRAVTIQERARNVKIDGMTFTQISGAITGITDALLYVDSTTQRNVALQNLVFRDCVGLPIYITGNIPGIVVDGVDASTTISPRASSVVDFTWAPTTVPYTVRNVSVSGYNYAYTLGGSHDFDYTLTSSVGLVENIVPSSLASANTQYTVAKFGWREGTGQSLNAGVGVRVDFTSNIFSGVSAGLDVPVAYIGTRKVNGTDSDVTSNLTFGTLSANNATLQDRMTITSTGNVGIGTNTPNNTLTVVGSLSVNSGVITTNSHLNVFQHWNNTATEFNGLNITINPSAYNVNSTPFRLTTTATGNPFFGVQGVAGYPFQQLVRVFGDERGLVFGPRQTGAGSAADFFSLRWQTGQVQLLNTATFGWADFPFGGTETLTIARDANDVLAQRRGTNPQATRIYNTYTAGTPISSEFAFLRWSGNTFQIGTSATGSGSIRQIEFLRDGLRAAFIDSGFFFNADAGFLTPGQIRLGAAQALYWNGRAVFKSPAVDQITLLNSTETGFNRLNFGGTTAAFPALKNSLSGIQVRRADDTDFAPLSASVITATSDIEIANAVSGIIFRSPDGNRWRVTMTNSGTLSSVLL